MDGSTNGDGTLRFMNQFKARETLENTDNLKIKKFWSIFFFCSITIYLSFFLIKKGWEPIKTNQINIKGAKNIPKEIVIESMAIKLPLSILELNPKELERNLKRNLSIKSVSVNRKLYPLGIEIKILERDPIAFAYRFSSNGQEKGMVDKEGEWIPLDQQIVSQGKPHDLIIDGWTAQNKKWIAFIFKNKKPLGIKLKRIIFTADGNINLQTENFLLILLGRQTNFLKQQLEIISHLSKSLPNELIKAPRTTLDLKNPSKPKLYLGKQEI